LQKDGCNVNEIFLSFNYMTQLQRLTIASDQLSGQRIQLTEPQQHYLRRVLRLKGGDRFIAMVAIHSSAGSQPQGWLTELQADPAMAQILEAVLVKTELPIAMTLIMALPKSGMDDVVRQATEIGVQTIVPVLSQRSLLNPSAQKLERWQRIAQEAAEQSERQFSPQILAPQAWSDALQTGQSSSIPTLHYLCEARGEHPHLLQLLLSQLLQVPCASTVPQIASVTIAVGPEGGWTEAEIAQAVEAGYQIVSLGRRVLRSATAPLVALGIVAAVSEGVGNQIPDPKST
jgi:16S rRNA (uracil1498-N3)-methyltransferase